MWCGYNDETILMHTSDGNIYRSRDRGLSWKRLKNLLQKQGNKVVDDNQEVRPKLVTIECSILLDWRSTQHDLESDRRLASCIHR